MTSSTNPDFIAPQPPTKTLGQTLKKTAKWTAVGILLTLGFLAAGGWILVLQLLIYVSTGGWKSFPVESRLQSQTTYEITAGKRTANLVLSGYEQGQEYGNVSIQVSVNGEFSENQVAKSFVPLASDYDNDWRQFGEADPGAYKLKDIDGDWKKDFLIRVGNRGMFDYYYISSRDGRGFQTDHNFENAQPWSSTPEAERQL